MYIISKKVLITFLNSNLLSFCSEYGMFVWFYVYFSHRMPTQAPSVSF